MEATRESLTLRKVSRTARDKRLQPCNWRTTKPSLLERKERRIQRTARWRIPDLPKRARDRLSLDTPKPFSSTWSLDINQYSVRGARSVHQWLRISTPTAYFSSSAPHTIGRCGAKLPAGIKNPLNEIWGNFILGARHRPHRPRLFLRPS